MRHVILCIPTQKRLNALHTAHFSNVVCWRRKSFIRLSSTTPKKPTPAAADPRPEASARPSRHQHPAALPTPSRHGRSLTRAPGPEPPPRTHVRSRRCPVPRRGQRGSGGGSQAPPPAPWRHRSGRAPDPRAGRTLKGQRGQQRQWPRSGSTQSPQAGNTGPPEAFQHLLCTCWKRAGPPRMRSALGTSGGSAAGRSLPPAPQREGAASGNNLGEQTLPLGILAAYSRSFHSSFL